MIKKQTERMDSLTAKLHAVSLKWAKVDGNYLNAVEFRIAKFEQVVRARGAKQVEELQKDRVTMADLKALEKRIIEPIKKGK